MTSDDLKILYSNIKSAHTTIEKATQSLTQLVEFARKSDPLFDLTGIIPPKPSIDVNRILATSEVLLPKIAVEFIDEVIAEGPAGPAASVEVVAGKPISKEA